MQAAISKNQVTNGVDVTALMATIDAVKADAKVADFQFRARNQWQHCGQNSSVIQGFRACGAEDGSRSAPFVLAADEPGVLLGTDQAPNPVEYVLHALAACVTTSIVYHAAARGIQIRALKSELRGDLDLRGFLGVDTSVRPGYQGIQMRIRADADAAPADLKALAQFSPVYDMIAKSVPVNLEVVPSH